MGTASCVLDNRASNNRATRKHRNTDLPYGAEKKRRDPNPCILFVLIKECLLRAPRRAGEPDLDQLELALRLQRCQLQRRNRSQASQLVASRRLNLNYQLVLYTHSLDIYQGSDLPVGSFDVILKRFAVDYFILNANVKPSLEPSTR